MSEKKSKAKKIIISVLIVVLIVSTICIFAVIKTKKKKNNADIINPVTQSPSIEEQINSDIINQKICTEYNGNYIFSSVVDIYFDDDLTIAEQNYAYYSISNTVKDKNSFVYYLTVQNNPATTKEKITLVNGKYTKVSGTTKTEKGRYYGNLDKSYVYITDPNGSITLNGQNYSKAFEISQTGYWISNKLSASSTTIYLREKLSYGNVGNKYLYVTYAYEMV